MIYGEKKCKECGHTADDHGKDGCYHIEYNETGEYLISCYCKLSFKDVITQEE